MKRSATAVDKFTLPIKYSDFIDRFMVTYSQDGEKVVVKTEEDLGSSVVVDEDVAIVVNLSQEETKKFRVGLYKIELKILTVDNKVVFSKEIQGKIEEVLNDEVF